MTSKFSKVFTALATPFNHNKLDLVSFQKLVEFQLAGNVSGLVVNGTTGESPTLQEEEVKSLFKATREVVGDKMPLILGTGSNCTSKTIECTKKAEDWGADGALVVTPYYNKPTQEGLFQHFTAVAENTQIPIILYNVPGRTITAIETATIVKLSEHPRIIGVKEASGDLWQGQQILSQVGEGFILTSGDDGTCLELATKGGHGVISVISNLIPAEMVTLMNMAMTGEVNAVKDFSKFYELMSALYVESNPIPVKMALYQMGLFSSPEMRLPLTTMTSAQAEKMATALQNLGIHK